MDHFALQCFIYVNKLRYGAIYLFIILSSSYEKSKRGTETTIVNSK